MSTALAQVEGQAAPPPVVLEVDGLTRDFGAFQAVRDVSFEVRAGQIFGFVGPNGAGKTTTMKMLATLDRPTSGDAWINGESVTESPHRARTLVGYMPDASASFPHTTVYEHLDFFARAFGLQGAERFDRVASVMDFLQLGALRQRLLDRLSKGMKQRVALARTLLNDPKLLLLDEPADGLDPRARVELRELLHILASEGKAIVISSHILTELTELCDACAIIEQGRILACGDIQEIMRDRDADAGLLDVRVRLVLRADVADIAARCEHALLEMPGVSETTTATGSIRFRLDGDEERAHQVLRALVAAGVPVCGFEIHTPDLEDAFMQVTKGQVQ